MTQTDLFNRLALHLLSQGRPATDSEGKHHYKVKLRRTWLTSAVGFIIPEQLYSLEMETKSVEAILQIIDTTHFYFKHMQLLSELELVSRSDYYTLPLCIEFKQNLEEVGVRHEVDLALMQQFKDVTAWKVVKANANKLQKQLGY
jgi:hypothetical protein